MYRWIFFVSFTKPLVENLKPLTDFASWFTASYNWKRIKAKKNLNITTYFVNQKLTNETRINNIASYSAIDINVSTICNI